jgi:hypothetical protein
VVSTPDPFAILGLDPQAELTDADVHRAWRRIATATHPDRPGGGDIARYTAASAAYTALRTAWGRGEARADLAEADLVASNLAGSNLAGSNLAGSNLAGARIDLAGEGATQPVRLFEEAGLRPPGLGPWAAGRVRAVWELPARVRLGRPGRLAVRAVVAVLACVVALRVSAGDPAGPGLVTGITTWFLLSGRGDLAPPPGR